MNLSRRALGATGMAAAATLLLGGCIVAPMAPPRGGPPEAVVVGPPVYAPMPAPVYEVAPPMPVAGYIWFGGFWAPRGQHWHWTPGRWGPPGHYGYGRRRGWR